MRRTFLHLNLDVLEWRQTIRDELKKQYHGRTLNMIARANNTSDIQLPNMRERLEDLEFHIGILEGEPRLEDGQPFKEGIGVVVLHKSEPAREDLPSIEAMVIGWCFLESRLYEDLWSQIAADNYSSCRISMYVGSFGFDVMEWFWDEASNPRLNIESMSVDFVRDKRPKEEAAQQRPGLFNR